MAGQQNQEIEQKKCSDLALHNAIILTAEELKIPLLQISHQAELGHQVIPHETLQIIKSTASQSLEELDDLLDALRLQQSILQDGLVPVSAGAALQDVAHDLWPLMQDSNSQIELTGTIQQPILAHPKALRLALKSLGRELINSTNNYGAHGSPQTPRQSNVFRLAAHKSRWGIVMGMYVSSSANTNNASTSLNTKTLRQAYGSSMQSRWPFRQIAPSGGAGIMVANSLFGAMQTSVHVSRFRRQTGFAATLSPSHQLSLV